MPTGMGHYVFTAPDAYGGHPTFKYTRLEDTTILALLASGWTVAYQVEGICPKPIDA